MASCDEDFVLLPEENTQPSSHHHFSHHYLPHCFCSDQSPITPPPSAPPSIIPATVSAAVRRQEDDVVSGEYGRSSFCTQEHSKCLPVFHEMRGFTGADVSNPFGEDENPDPDKIGINLQNEGRKDRDEQSDGGTTPYSCKKSRVSNTEVGSAVVGGEYRKDREEWCDMAIGCLLDAYTEKFTLLNRGNLRGRDWESVAAVVSDRCEKQIKTVEQCKNKVDNLKKRYKLERQRMINGGHLESHWPWFRQMEQIVGNPWQGKVLGEESLATSACIRRQSKRYMNRTPSHIMDLNNIKSKTLLTARWRRVVFRISGAALAGDKPHNFDPRVAMIIAEEVAIACRLGVEVAIVVGGSNFFCDELWVDQTGLDRSTAYQISMMATVMNSILLQSAMEKLGVKTRVQTTFMQEIAEPYSRQRAIRHLEKGRVVIFGGIGATAGSPLFSTDSAVALRASEIHAEAFVKGVDNDGVYDFDNRNATSVMSHISFRELNSRRVMSIDMTALSICEENGISVVVFNMDEEKVISRALCGEKVGNFIDKHIG